MTHALEVAEAIDERLAEARQEIATLEAAREVMTQRGSGGRSARTRRQTGRTARPRATKAVSPAALEELLGGEDGMTSVTLANRAGGRRLQVLALLRELEGQGRVRRSGQRRGTRWHLVTDDDRIVGRAVQPAKQRRRTAS